MDIMELGAIGELVGGVAVVVTLVYLAIQVRQNTSAIQATTLYQAVDPMWDAALIPAQDPQFSDVLLRGLGDPRSLAPPERHQFIQWSNNILYAYENLFRLYEGGQVGDEAWSNALLSSDWLFGSPGLRAVAETRQGPTSRRFFAYLNQRLGPPNDAYELPL